MGFIAKSVVDTFRVSGVPAFPVYPFSSFMPEIPACAASRRTAKTIRQAQGISEGAGIGGERCRDGGTFEKAPKEQGPLVGPEAICRHGRTRRERSGPCRRLLHKPQKCRAGYPHPQQANDKHSWAVTAFRSPGFVGGFSVWGGKPCPHTSLLPRLLPLPTCIPSRTKGRGQ